MLCTAGGIVLSLLYKRFEGRRLIHLLPITLVLLNGLTQGYATWRDGAELLLENQIAIVCQAAQIISR